MNALATAIRITVLAPLQPRRACVQITRQSGMGWILLAACTAHAVLAVVQWATVRPVLVHDPLFAGAGTGLPAGVLPAAWAAVAAAAALVLRAAVLGTVLHTAGGGARRSRWAAWAACADGALWIESAAATAVVHWAQPADLAALRAVRLHAGLDLFWPQAAWLGNLNVFTAWWSALLAAGMSYLGRTSRRRAFATALACAVCRAATSAVWSLW